MQRIILSVSLLLALCGSIWAQEARHEVTVQGSGFFTKETTDSGVTNNPTSSGGVLAGYRFNINEWLAVEGDYDYFSNSQRYLNAASLAAVQTNVHAVTGTAVIKLPETLFLKPYVLAWACPLG